MTEVKINRDKIKAFGKEISYSSFALQLNEPVCLQKMLRTGMKIPACRPIEDQTKVVEYFNQMRGFYVKSLGVGE